MTAFLDFLRNRLDTGGFSTEDALASFLPLAREVNELHAGGYVAPLAGASDLQVDGVQIWYEEAKRLRPKQPAAVEQKSTVGCAPPTSTR